MSKAEMFQLKANEFQHPNLTLDITSIINKPTYSSQRNINNETRTIYLYDQATDENWEKYAHVLQQNLTSKKAFSIIEWHDNDIPTLNYLWDIISTAITGAANQHIPNKKIKLKALTTHTSRGNNHNIEDSIKERKCLLRICKIIKTWKRTWWQRI